VSTSLAQASIRCSQLSKTSNTRLVRKKSTSASVNGRSGCSRRPRAAATAPGTRSPSESDASSTSHTPSE
jgi:hypothetical protein